MTENQAFLEYQAESLKQSALTLVAVCEKLSLDPQLAKSLADLSTQLSGNPPLRARPVAIDETPEILTQARASLNLLMLVGYVAQGKEEGLQSALDALERAIAEKLRRRISARVHGLYVIIDPEVTASRDPLEVARGTLHGGAKMLQLRDKLREKGQTIRLARALKELCAEYDALLIVNDHADLAAVVGADGLHVGQGDLPVAEARRILDPRQIIGRSNHLSEEARESQAQGADHVALGAIYPTSTKMSISGRAAIGPEAIRRVKEVVSVPVVAIGGINEENVDPVVRAGADAICVTSAVGLAPDPEGASRRLVEKIVRAGGKA